MIEYCITNLEKSTLATIEELKALFPNAKVQEWGCLGHCKHCFRSPYVYINESLVVDAPTPAELVEAVKKIAVAESLPQRS